MARNESAIWLRSKRALASWGLLIPAALLLVAFYAVPIARVLWISVTEPTAGVGNYLLLFTDAGVRRVLLTTFRISFITTAISILLAYAVAYALVHASAANRRIMLMLVILPFWISVLVRAFSWMVLLGREGVVNNALMSLGLVSAPIQLMYNEFGVDVGMVHYMVPVATLILYANMLGIDRSLFAAARNLGASPAQVFMRIFLPLSLAGVLAASVLVFVFSTGFFVTPALLGGGKTLMAAEYISLMVNETLRWGTATMLASTLLLIILVLLVILSRIFNVRKLFGGAW